MKASYFAQAARITAPVFFGYIAIGIPFGLMVASAGYPVWLAPVMSIVMYAGAGQYAAMGLFAAGASLGTIAITELLVNIRHVVYGLSLITKFKHTGTWKPYIIFALTDETYSLLTSCTVPDGADAGAFYGTIALLDHIYWIAGGIIGAVAGTFIPFSFEGVEFALTALFIVLLLEQLEKSRDVLPPVLGALVALCSVALARCGVIADGNILLVSLAFSLAALVFVRGRKFNNAAVRGKTIAKTAAQEREVEK
ncbi:MAG: AzlC family ABC transporter permease [Treponema sp.]|nr:AzlC family ABC transporter permease [Treponema sp.]